MFTNILNYFSIPFSKTESALLINSKEQGEEIIQEQKHYKKGNIQGLFTHNKTSCITRCFFSDSVVNAVSFFLYNPAALADDLLLAVTGDTPDFMFFKKIMANFSFITEYAFISNNTLANRLLLIKSVLYLSNFSEVNISSKDGDSAVITFGDNYFTVHFNDLNNRLRIYKFNRNKLNIKIHKPYKTQTEFKNIYNIK